MAKSIGLSRADMDHPDLHKHIDNHIFGDGTSTLARPTVPMGGDATRSVVPAEVDPQGSVFGAKKPGQDPVLPSLAGAAIGSAGVAAVAGSPAAAGFGAGVEAYVRAGESVARDIYHATDDSPKAKERAQSRIR